MSLIVSANSGGKDFAIHPATVTPARCTRIIDLGTVDGEWKGKAKKVHKIVFCFESAVLMDDDAGEFAGTPYLIIQRYTASLSEKSNMRKDLEAWRGRKFTSVELDAFDLKNVIGKACMVNMIHTDPKDGKVYSNIGSIMPMMAGATCPPVADKAGLIFFSLTDFSQEVYDKLSPYFQQEVAKSDEFKELMKQGLAKEKATTAEAAKPAVIDDDDIPF